MTNDNSGLVTGPDNLTRCKWGAEADKPDYVAYHDNEWGFPVSDDRRLFEKICLEGFQAGLSWLTILRKRQGFRVAFKDFDIVKVAAMDEGDVERLVLDAAIVRHRGKIKSTINNAKRALEMQKEFGSLAAYFWGYEPKQDERPENVTWAWLMENPTSSHSTAISKDLKKRGWSFVGPTTIYAFMQAMGLVNDHVEGCHCRERAQKLRAEFIRPGM
ncbi:MAG: DNA-3-methyladenine glycosylase I [Rhizobiaceae bacterium]|nr:DNA-3-methyladenine glycosylase I [Rhizobiaceae bacterium]